MSLGKRKGRTAQTLLPMPHGSVAMVGPLSSPFTEQDFIFSHCGEVTQPALELEKTLEHVIQTPQFLVGNEVQKEQGTCLWSQSQLAGDSGFLDPDSCRPPDIKSRVLFFVSRCFGDLDLSFVGIFFSWPRSIQLSRPDYFWYISIDRALAIKRLTLFPIVLMNTMGTSERKLISRQNAISNICTWLLSVEKWTNAEVWYNVIRQLSFINSRTTTEPWLSVKVIGVLFHHFRVFWKSPIGVIEMSVCYGIHLLL